MPTSPTTTSNAKHTAGAGDKCDKKLYRRGGRWDGSPCRLPPKVFENGKWYCSIHCKAGVDARTSKFDAKLRKDDAARKARWAKVAEDARKLAAFPALLAACDGTPNPAGVGTLDNQWVLRQAVLVLLTEGHKTLSAELEAIAKAQAAALTSATGGTQ